MVLTGQIGFFRRSIRASFKVYKARLQERPDGGEIMRVYGCAGPRKAQRGHGLDGPGIMLYSLLGVTGGCTRNRRGHS